MKELIAFMMIALGMLGGCGQKQRVVESGHLLTMWSDFGNAVPVFYHGSDEGFHHFVVHPGKQLPQEILVRADDARIEPEQFPVDFRREWVVSAETGLIRWTSIE